MKRAAIIIGVDRTGNLPRLSDAVKGAQRMAEWATSQEFDTVLITDLDGAVEARTIRAAVTAFVNKGIYDQMLVYFAGHGVNIRYGEYWLLSDAPGDPQAAVNVEGSAVLARYSGIGHVVFISDACRTAAEGVRAQFVTGSEIFPNEGIVDQERPVDQFYACTLGQPAYELRNVADSASKFSAVYTGAVISALKGALPDAIDWGAGNGGEEVAYVRPRLLKKAVAANVGQRISELGMTAGVIQVPDARISSDQDAWLSRLEELPVSATRKGRGRGQAAPTAAEYAGQKFKSALKAPVTVSTKSNWHGLTLPPQSQGTCAFSVEGAKFIAVHRRTNRALPNLASSLAHLVDVEWGGESVLLITDTDRCIVLPALRDFLVRVVFEHGELTYVDYEPSKQSPRREHYMQRANEIGGLRALAAESSQNGIFRLDRDDALLLAQKMQYAKGIDPTLALYAAYAYDSLQERDLIRQMSRWMAEDLGCCWFDLWMLSYQPSRPGPEGDRSMPLLSPFPMLAQGWARLSALDMKLPGSLAGLPHYLASSLWTAFTLDAAPLLLYALNQGDLR